jgi:hypothetical protein
VRLVVLITSQQLSLAAAVVRGDRLRPGRGG